MANQSLFARLDSRLCGDHDTAFGRTETIDQMNPTRPCVDIVLRHGLTRQRKALERGDLVWGENAGHRWGQSGGSDLVFVHRSGQAVSPVFFGRNAQGCTRNQRSQNVQDTGVKGMRGELKHTTLGENAECLESCNSRCAERPVLNDHTTGLARGSRSVDRIVDIAGAVGRELSLRILPGGTLLISNHNHFPTRDQLLRESLLIRRSQDQRSLQLLTDLLQTVCGLRRINQQESRTGLENGQQRKRRPFALGEAQRHKGIGANLGSDSP